LDEYLKTLRLIDAPEAEEIIQQIEDGNKVIDFHTFEFREMTSIGSFDEIYQSRIAALTEMNSTLATQMARRINEMLVRKQKGERVLQNISLTLANKAVYEFWQLECSWIGWKNFDAEVENSIEELDLL